MAIYEGKVRIRLHPVKGIILDKGVPTSTLTADDAETIMLTMVEAAKANNCGIDKWSMFIPELAQSMTKSEVQIPVGKVLKYMDDAEMREAVIRTNKFGGPRLDYCSVEKTLRKSKIMDIA